MGHKSAHGIIQQSWSGREEDVRIQGEQEKANGEYKKIEKWSVVVSSEVSDQQEDFEE